MKYSQHGNLRTGELQLVPATDPTSPSITTWKFSPCAATSGNALPETLNMAISLAEW